MADIIQVRRGTAATATSTNPVLADGELGFETDTKKGKLGDGVTPWNSLPYFFSSVELGSVVDQIIAAGVKTVPVDADYFPITDSAAGNILKKLSWASIKAMFNALYAAATHNHSAGDINSGTLGTARGGTGLAGFTATNYLRALNASTLENRTPAQVLSDIGAQAAGSYAAASHSQNASTIQAGAFGAGDYSFPAKLSVDGQGGSSIQAAGNSGTALTINWNAGNIHTMTLNGNCTLTLSNPVAGFPYSVLITMDATLRTLTWPVAVKWTGGTTPTLSGVSKKDAATLVWDGTIYWGTWTPNVA